MGYWRAGFEVTGVDINSQPNYPFEFIRGDALEISDPDDMAEAFDVIHASPPCQAFTAMGTMANAREHADLLTPTRELLRKTGLPYVIENVPGAPMETGPPSLFSDASGVVLCGSMFDLRNDEYELRRHRLFESNIALPQPHCRHRLPVVGFYGDHARIRSRVDGSKDRGTDIVGTEAKLALVASLMDIDWMTWPESNQAIPPPYTKWIGRHLIDALEVAA